MFNLFRKYFNSFAKKPDVWFFYAFLIASTLSIRKVLFYYPIVGSFNEYTGIYVYLSDIFLLLTLITWILSLCNNSLFLSSNNFSSENYVPLKTKNVPRGTFLWVKKTYQQVIHNYVLFFPLFIAIFSFLSILWSENYQIAFFRSLKLFGFVLLFFYVYKKFHACLVAENCSTWNNSLASRVEQNVNKNNKCSTWNIFRKSLTIFIIIGLIQSIIGIIQFCIQHSIGFLWLKESIISTEIPGVAKLIFSGHPYIRAYGLFPHPNIFGGFLVFSIMSSLLYFILFHPPRLAETACRREAGVEQFICLWGGTLVKFTVIAVQILALLLTFSKSAIIGLFIGFFYLYIKKCSAPVQMFHVEHYTGKAWNILSILKTNNFYRKIFLIISIAVLTFFILKPNIHSLLFKSLEERIFYLNVSRGTFLSNPLLGTGSGQFVINMKNIANIQSWQYQPVHNVFLLIVNEYGIIIFVLFLFFIYKMFHVEHFTRQTCASVVSRHFRAVFLGFLFIMLFDHYFWDIQQGQILLWLAFGIVAGSNRE